MGFVNVKSIRKRFWKKAAENSSNLVTDLFIIFDSKAKRAVQFFFTICYFYVKTSL